MFDAASEKFALEMLKQYYEDLRSMYNSVLNIFKLSSMGIAIVSAMFTFYKFGTAGEQQIEVPTSMLIAAFVIVFLFLFISATIVIGQAYRYRITQGMCHLIRSKYHCDIFVPQDLLGYTYFYKEHGEIKTNIAFNDGFLKFIPTLFRHIFIFFWGCCYLFSFSVALFAKKFSCSIFFIIVVIVCVVTVIFQYLTQIYGKKTKRTLDKINDNLKKILESRISEW